MENQYGLANKEQYVGPDHLLEVSEGGENERN